MTEEQKKDNNKVAAVNTETSPKNPKEGGAPQRSSFAGRGRERRAPRRERVRPEFDQKILAIRRVTRVVSGGRRLSFSVTLVAGDRKGSVGIGVGKAADTSLAIEKAFRNAKKNMVKVNLNKRSSIRHEVRYKYCGSDVFIMPVFGDSIIAGSATRAVLEFAGIRGVAAKIFSRSRNQINVARATVFALKQLKDSHKKKN